MGASLSCLDPVQDQSYTLSRKHVGRAESIAEYKARKNADKLKLLKKSGITLPPPAPVEPVAPPAVPVVASRGLPVEEPEPVVEEEIPEKLAEEIIPEKPISDAVIPTKEEKPDVLILGPFEVDEKAQKALPNDATEPEVVAGATEEVPLLQEETNGLPKDVIPSVMADEIEIAQDSSVSNESGTGATQSQQIYKETPTPMPAADQTVPLPPVETIIKPRPVSNVSNVSEVPEFPELSDGDGMMVTSSSEVMFGDKSYAHPELEIGTKVCDPVTGMLVTVDEYRTRSSQRSSGLVKEYVNLYEQIDESAMKDKKELEKQRSARISQRNMKPIN